MSRLKQKLDACKDCIGKTELWQLFLTWRCFGMGQTANRRSPCQLNKKPFATVPGREKSIWAFKNTKNITPGSWIPWVCNTQQLGGHLKRTLEEDTCPLVVAKCVQGPRQNSFALPHLPRRWHWLNFSHFYLKSYLRFSGQSTSWSQKTHLIVRT